MPRLPGIHRFELPNGLTVILAPDDSAPVVAFYNWVRTGSADEIDSEAGLAHVLEHMLFKGTARRGVGEIAQEIEGCGGDINAFTSFDTTVYYVLVASRFFDAGLDVLVDAVNRSIIDPGELELEKEVILEEIKRGEDTPGNQLSEALFSLSFKKHPYRRPVIGYRDVVAGASRDQIFAFYRKWYTPGNMVFVAAGAFDPREAKKKIRAAFKEVPARRRRAQRRTAEPQQTRFRGTHVAADAQEVYFDLGFHVPGLRHPDVAALDVLTVALGQGTRSRLAWRLRRSERVVTTVSCFAYTPRDPGLLLVSGTTPVDRGVAAVEGTLDEIFHVLRDGVTEEELERARTSIEGDAVYERETVQGIARKLGFFETVGGDIELEQRYYDAVAVTTLEDVSRVAKRYLKPQNLTAATLAPPGADVPDTAQVGKWANAAFKRHTGRRARTKTRTGRESVQRLPNGATLVVRSDRGVPIVSMRAVFLGGLRLEDERTNGLSNLISRVQAKGTERRSYSEVLRLVDSWAGAINGFAGYNSFGLRMDVLSRHFTPATELFVDVLARPAFDTRELDVDRGHVLEAIKSMEDHLSSWVMRLFSRTMYRHHPYRMSLLGTPALVAGYEREDLQSFYAARALPDNMVLAVVGDVHVDEVVDELGRHLEGWRPNREFAIPEVEPEPPITKPREVVAHKDREQAHLVIGFPGVRLTDDDRLSLEVLASILAGQGGRLFVELRDRQGLAYSVTAFSQEAYDPGYFAVYMATDPAKLDRAIEGIRVEIARIKRDGVRKDELKRNARQIVGGYEIDLQRGSARAASLAFNERYGLGYDYYRRYPRDIMAVTTDDVLEAARTYLDFDRAVTAIIKPGSPASEMPKSAA